MTCIEEPIQAHFVLVPLMAPGHMIPMVDMARLLAERGVRSSIITTPVSAARFKAVIEGIKQSNLPIEFVEFVFPGKKLGLPDGCESADLVTEKEHIKAFFDAVALLAEPLEVYIRSLHHHPDCIIADSMNPWAVGVACRLGIPRLVFHGPSCFFLLATNRLDEHKVHERVSDDFEPLDVPDFPVRVTMNKATTLGIFQLPGQEDLRRELLKAEAIADGLLINSFHNLEHDFITSYEKAMAKKVWAIGPLCMCNEDADIKAARANQATIARDSLISWLDSQAPGSVLYGSFGSMARSSPKQIIELGCGLEASNQPFIWVIKDGEISDEVKQWFAEGFEERTKDRGLVIRGWAPQRLILSHHAVGAFLTHCGWNSTLEAICHGMPMVTWPHFADQFINEALVVQVLRIGVSVGIRVPSTHVPEDSDGVQVRREDLEKAVAKVMNDGPEGRERRERAKALAEEAKKAMEEGGSSYEDMTDMIRFVLSCGSKTKEENGH